MKRLLFISSCLAVVSALTLSAQDVSINVNSTKTAGIIDETIYGQLFEHIYFSANNGVWQEMIYERSFEPEHYPGITPRDGYFDGWYADDDQILHSPTRYEQPINVTSVDSDSYEINMDIDWRAYKLARRSWSGGLHDIRIAFRNQADGTPVYFRIHDPYYESQTFSPLQTAAMAEAAERAKAMEELQKAQNQADFSFAKMVEREVSMRGRSRVMNVLEPMKSYKANKDQINSGGQWHHLRIVVKGKSAKAYWDGKAVLSSTIEGAAKNDIVLWENYTETYYKNIKVTSTDGKKVYFEGMPKDVLIPTVAPQWNAFGNGRFEMMKDDAVNMRYSQKISSPSVVSGVAQGPQSIIAGEKYIGSIYAKGDSKATLSVAMKSKNGYVARQVLGKPGKDWQKYEFELSSASYNGDADFAIEAEGGTLQVDMATMSTKTGLDLGGFRPDIFKAVKDLHPTLLRWPGGGYVAQYHWQWGVGPQEARERWPHWMWMDYDQNCFGIDEFMRFCREINTEPVMVVSVAFERPEAEYDSIMEEALNWLRYCNEPATGEWGAKRAANGHPEPYNVKYWEIDNEMWEMGIERYEKCVRDYSTAMREIDPSIKIIACGGFPDDEGFLKRSANYFDFLSLHHYEQQGGYLTGPVRLGQQYNRYAEMIAASPNPHIKLFISEWNLQSIDWRTGLFAGGFLNMCENTPVVGMGAAALFIRRTDMPDWNNAFINFDYKDLFVAPNYQVTKLWYDNYTPYRLEYTGDVKDLSVATTLSEDGSHVIVKLVNATEKPITIKVNGDWAGIASTSYEFYAPGDLMAANSMEDKNRVALKTASPKVADNAVTLTVDAYSAGVLKINKQF